MYTDSLMKLLRFPDTKGELGSRFIHIPIAIKIHIFFEKFYILGFSLVSLLIFTYAQPLYA